MVAFVVGQFSDGERQRDTVASGRTRLEEGTFIGSGGPTTTLYDNSGPFHDFGSPSLNDSGTAAFVAFLDTGEVGIFTGSGGPTTTISDTRGLFNFFAVPSLNDDGTVAFFATLNTGGAGFFTGNGGPPHDYRRQQRI